MTGFLLLTLSICMWVDHGGLQRIAAEWNNFSMENVLSGFSLLNSGAMKQSYGCISVPLINGYTEQFMKKKSPYNRPSRTWKRSRVIALHIFNLGARRGWVVNTTPRLFYLRERPGTHCAGGWVGPRTGLDVCEKSCPHRYSIRGPSSP
jgi:hypothetical protein